MLIMSYIINNIIKCTFVEVSLAMGYEGNFDVLY
jgi:hypothetical protein